MKMLQEKESAKTRISPEAKKAIASMPVDKQLYLLLQQLRLTIADEQKVPAYFVFTNSTLTDMCVKLPATPEELLDVSGIGKVKAEQYGERFLNAIAEFLSENETKRDALKILD
jgi:ATP-dependent DNA helicase RecQ